MGEARKIAAILVADVVGYSRLAGADASATSFGRSLRGARRLAACRTEVCGCSSDGFLRFAAAVAAQSGFVGVRLSLLDRRWSWIDGAPGRAPPSIGGGEGEQSLDVPGHGHEAPLAAGFFEPAQ